MCTNNYYMTPDYTCAENNHLARVTSGFRARGAATPAAQRAQPGPTPHPRRMPRATSFASWTEPASCDTHASRSKKRMPATRRDDHTDENMDPSNEDIAASRSFAPNSSRQAGRIRCSVPLIGANTSQLLQALQ